VDEVDSVGDDLGLAAAVQPLLLVGRRRARGQDQREGAQERVYLLLVLFFYSRLYSSASRTSGLATLLAQRLADSGSWPAVGLHVGAVLADGGGGCGLVVAGAVVSVWHLVVD